MYFRVNQRSEEFPAPDRIETSEVVSIAPQSLIFYPKLKTLHLKPYTLNSKP